jgi:hypothetical protein
MDFGMRHTSYISPILTNLSPAIPGPTLSEPQSG